MQAPPPAADPIKDYDADRLDRLKAAGIPLFPHRFSHTAELITSTAFRERFNTLVPNPGDALKDGEKNVALTGRILSIRTAGKLVFIDLIDQNGKTQLKFDASTWSAKNIVSFEIMKRELRDGDMIGAYGFAVRTKTGELTLAVLELELLAPRLRLIPPKLDDIAARMRDRTLDLIVHPEARERVLKRVKIVSLIRDWLSNKYGLLEVETPILQPIAGGADARPFETHHNALNASMFLRIATELPLKMAVIAGYHQGVFDLGKVFRNEGIDDTHSPEFTSNEAYFPYKDYIDLMTISETILSDIAEKITGSLEVTYQGKKANWKAPWKRIDYLGELKKVLGDPEDFPADDQIETNAALQFFKRHCDARGFVSEAQTVTKFMDKLFGKLVEPGLIDPTFVCHHPQMMCPLAKFHRSRPGLTERFELFVFGKEIANAYTELNDPVKQRHEFAVQAGNREKGDDEAQIIDETFCRALEFGLPPTAGIGFGVDRLAMFLTDTAMLRDVQLFPMAPSTLVSKPVKKGGYAIGIRRETKNNHERRAPLAPQHVRTLTSEDYRVLVQRSAIRAFTDAEYERAGAELVDRLDEATLILGVKEVPIDDLLPNRTYMFFSHTFKGRQHHYNMRRLSAYLKAGIRLIDYELILTADHKRAAKFGPYAGMGGMIDTLHGLGLRLLDLGYATPFLYISRAYAYRTIQEAEAAVRRAGEEIAAFGLPEEICPLTFTFTSMGDTSKEAQRIFRLLPHFDVRTPAELAKICQSKERFALPVFVATHEHMVAKNGDKPNTYWTEEMKRRYYMAAGKKEDFEAGKVPASLTDYHPIFHTQVLPFTSVLMNCMYWDPRYHRLITNVQMRELVATGRSRLLCDGDLTCDPLGSVQYFSHDTPINNAFYMYDPATDSETEGIADAPKGAVMMYGVSHIPAELSRDATTFFGNNLLSYVERIANVPYEKEFEKDTLPANVQAATETYRGRLTPHFAYLQASLDEFAKPDPKADKEDGQRDKARR